MPDIVGKGIANPIAQNWSGATMLDRLGLPDAASSIMSAIETVLASKDAPNTPTWAATRRPRISRRR